MSRRSPLAILRAVKLETDGLTHAEIAAEMNISVSTVHQYLGTPEAVKIRTELKSRALDTMADIQTDFQAGAPLARRVLETVMLDGNVNPATRARAAEKYLEFAGHKPIERVHLIDRKGDLEQEYQDKTDDEIRNSIIEGLDDGSQKKLGLSTIH